MRRLIFVLTLLCFISLWGAEKERMLTVLYTNDAHGMAWAFDEPDSPSVGGLPARKTLIDKIRAEIQGKGGNLMILSAGDITLGDPRSNVCHNLPLIKGMNLIGYDAMTIGNHEFDFGLDIFYHMKKEASFPFLSANIYKDGGTTAVGKEYIEKVYPDGLKVAVLGVTTRETEQITESGLEGKLVMTDPIQEAKTRIPLLRKKNDIVIALSHLGYYESDKSFDGYYGDNYLAKNVPGIDLIIGGHTQTHLATPVKIGDTYITQTEGLGKWVGRFDFYLKGNRVVKTSFKLYPINIKKKIVKKGKISYEYLAKRIKENKTMKQMLDGFQCSFSTKKLCVLDRTLSSDRSIVRMQESELGDIITDIIREKAKADIAIINGGSIRKGLAKGDVTELDVYSVFPFMDTLVTLPMKGYQVQELLDLFAEKGVGGGGFFQVSGISFKIYKGSALEIKVNGRPLQKKKTYIVATNSFLANGGDGYLMLRSLKNKKNTGYSIPAIMVDYIKKHQKLPKPKMNRFSIIK